MPVDINAKYFDALKSSGEALTPFLGCYNSQLTTGKKILVIAIFSYILNCSHEYSHSLIYDTFSVVVE